MSDSFNERKKAMEDEYFHKQNQEALKRLAARKVEHNEAPVRKSPITGEPLIQKTIAGVVVDICEKSGGVWLDAGELEQILENSQKDHNWLSGFFGHLKNK